MDYYWEIIQHDGTRTEIPPESVEVVKRRWNNHEPIHTTDESIPASQIKTFRKTAKPFNAQPLLDAAAQAFDEPVLNPNGSIVYKWVKKPVAQNEYAKHFSHLPAYRKLANDSGLVVVAFKLPVHAIDVNKVENCTDEEVLQLNKS